MNQYNYTPIPPKEKLESLYYSGMTQTEIGEMCGVSQRIVFGWFRKLGIKSRIAKKRNQFGKNNSSWKGKRAGYDAFHMRVKALRGTPKECDVCGTDDKKHLV